MADVSVTLAEWLLAQRPSLERLAEGLDAQLRSELGVAEDDAIFRMYVVGNAGIGKSTLLNALLNDRMPILPHGGCGPYTARAARIRYASDPYFAITYRQRSAVEDLVACLSRRGTNWRNAERDARLLVLGDQFGHADPSYLAACLRDACAGHMSTHAHEKDRGRLSVLSELLASGQRRHIRHAGSDLPAFLMDLETHGAGFLSVLVEDIEIGWQAEFLRNGLELVDLPGVGVANDAYREATKQALSRAHAVLLVVDRSGLTKDAADLLTSFLTSWANDTRGAFHLVIAAVKVDLVADDSRAEARDRRAWVQHFDAASTAIVTLIHGQLRAELTRVFGPLTGSRLTTLLRRAKVRPVAPVEHQRFHRRDLDDPARICDEEDARVRALRETLAEVAAANRALVATAVDEALETVSLRDVEQSSLATQLRAELAQIMSDF